MTVSHARVEVRSKKAVDTVDITRRVSEAVERSGIRDGVCVVAVMHTTAGVFVNENADPDVQRDVIASLARIVPDDAGYAHAEGNSPGHIKSVLVGASVTIPVRSGSLDLGRWQGIYVAEFDGPRERSATITCIGDRAG